MLQLFVMSRFARSFENYVQPVLYRRYIENLGFGKEWRTIVHHTAFSPYSWIISVSNMNGVVEYRICPKTPKSAVAWLMEFERNFRENFFADFRKIFGIFRGHQHLTATKFVTDKSLRESHEMLKRVNFGFRGTTQHGFEPSFLENWVPILSKIPNFQCM